LWKRRALVEPVKDVHGAPFSQPIDGVTAEARASGRAGRLDCQIEETLVARARFSGVIGAVEE